MAMMTKALSLLNSVVIQRLARYKLIQKPLRNPAITINAAVGKERPVAADIFKMFQVALADQDFFFIVRGFYDDPPKGIAEKRSAPEFKALALGAIATNVTKLVPHAIDHADKNAIGNRVRALDSAPGIVLHRAKLSFFVGVPADCRGIEKNVCALQSRQTRAFRIPLVPANKRSYASIFRVKGLEAEIA